MTVSLLITVIIFGLVLGGVVGMTAIGKGLLGAPVLILLGARPEVAVGTIGVAGFFMMVSGACKHYRNGYVDWKTVAVFSAVSVPVSFYAATKKVAVGDIIPLESLIGAAIILSVLTLVYKFFISSTHTAAAYDFTPLKAGITAVLGAVLGFFIGITSISGSLIIIAFILLLNMPERLAIGSTSVVAIFSLGAAAVAHIAHGHVDWPLFAVFTPAVTAGAYAGAHYTNVVPQKPLRIIILALLVMAAVGVFLKRSGYQA